MNSHLHGLGALLWAAAGIASAGLAGCGGDDHQEAEAGQRPPVQVRVETIQARNEAGIYRAVGRVKNARESTIASKVMGKVRAVRVKAGDLVKEGELLISIGDNDVGGQVGQSKGALAQAEAARVIARQSLDRMEALKATDSVTSAQYDMAVFDYHRALGAVEQARGALRSAQSFLQETRVIAPFSGRIIDTLIEEGEMASPGSPLVRIEGKGDLEFEASVTAHDITAMKVGQAVTVELDTAPGNPRAIAGDIHEIVPAMDRVTHSNTVRVRLGRTEGLLSGTFGRVLFFRENGRGPGVLVDRDRLVRTGQLTGVFVVGGDERIRLRLVREGLHYNGKVEVLSGLSVGDRLVVSPTSALEDGQPARVVP